MIPGGTYKGIIEGHSSDNDVAPEIIEYRASPHRKISSFNGPKRGMTSNTAVHELLECPVCTNVMYPPIHQVITPSLLYISCLIQNFYILQMK